MSNGREQLHRLHSALGEFEEAVIRREHKGLAQSKMALQQEVDRAREAMVKVVERERDTMRAEFMKQAAELQMLWKEREDAQQRQGAVA